MALAFQRLFRTYRFVEPGEADEMLRVYFEALADYETRDIEAGIHNMLSGRVDGFNPSFLPPAPLVAKSVRDAMHHRLDAEHRARKALPPPADDWQQDPPEVRARNKARLEQLAESLGRQLRTEDAENDRKAKELTARVNARFAPEMDSRSMAKRLGLAIDVGDEPEADWGDMGGERAAS